ncbi:MAG: hypothetical protein NC237_11040, partial [Eubacterium sp.]|nr:hypothetical protein [Eubacterium sp.]
MTEKEIVNLIDKLEAEGMSSDKIVEIVRYIEPGKNIKESESETTMTSKEFDLLISLRLHRTMIVVPAAVRGFSNIRFVLRRVRAALGANVTQHPVAVRLCRIFAGRLTPFKKIL